MDLTQYNFSFTTHRNKKIVKIDFQYNSKLVKELRIHYPSARYSKTMRSWYLPDLPAVRASLKLQPSPLKTAAQKGIHPINQEAYNKMQSQLILKAYGKSTINIYLGEFYHLLNILQKYPVNDLSPQRLKDYFLYCVEQLGYKERKMNGKINAIKFYFEQVLHRPKMFFDIPRPKKPITLPKMLSKSEVKSILTATKNPKHKLALTLCYGLGLRVSEVVALKIEDIDGSRMMIAVRGAKGKKDRYLPIPKTLLRMLREYYKVYKPEEYVLQGQYGGPYSTSSVQNVFKKAMRNAGIHKKIGIHGLRHSYATHLLESGADMRFIQELLGHHSIKTTQIYTKVTRASLEKICSPLETL